MGRGKGKGGKRDGKGGGRTEDRRGGGGARRADRAAAGPARWRPGPTPSPRKKSPSEVNDKDLAKELYKKYSSVHRRKIRVWQMICILSQFVDADVVQKVTSTLHTCLYRNNLPAVRQYLENFAIKIYLKFPTKIKEQLIPILLDQSMKPQALSSYVFIAANLILHTPESSDQLSCLNELLPPVITFLTAHHHSLRGFTQILVYRVLDKLLPACDTTVSEVVSLERRCLNAIKTYLHENADCRRLVDSRHSILGFWHSTLRPNGRLSPVAKPTTAASQGQPEQSSMILEDLGQQSSIYWSNMSPILHPCIPLPNAIVGSHQASAITSS
ncbi:hypothetical protein EJ110_NYTH56897 [Nymphaea thermarum]|nr:hypothetical protein EJ110_NYTH56897 [Nymphaea thermarum]